MYVVWDNHCFNLDGVSFESRWRHTANLVKGGVVLIIGGRNKHGTALRDIWGLDTSNMKLEKVCDCMRS